MLSAFLPPGRVWRLADSVLSKLLLAFADELARVDGRANDLYEEADPRTADELIPEYERELALATDDILMTLATAPMGVETSGADWAATLTALVPGISPLTLSVQIAESFPNTIEVRDNEVFVFPSWVSAIGTIGVLAGAGGGLIVWTVADLETAIDAGSLLAQVTTPDANPTNVLLEQVERLGAFSGDDERRARIVARTIARQRYRPVDFQTALAPLLGQDADDVVVIETTHAQAVAMGDVREIYRFFILRDPNVPGTYYLDSAQELVDQIKPSHTSGHMIETTAALYDDPHSLYDRDLLEGTPSFYDELTTLYDLDVYGA